MPDADGHRPVAAPQGGAAALAAVTPRDRRRIVAHLAGSLGLPHLALAEDALQTALLRALERWPTQGAPANPAGWLYLVARRCALDALRHQAPLDPWPDDDDTASGAVEARLATAPPAGRFIGEIDDEELALLCAACHPALPPATQVALALRTLLGLPLADVAAALLVNEAAVAQRLARARTRLAGERLDMPAGDELPPRRDSVLGVLSLMFLAGLHGAAPADRSDRGTGATRDDTHADPRQACWEAIRLARAVAAHPAIAHPDADALAALLLLHGARLTGRWDAQGDIVPLPGQPRDRWDRGMIAMGLHHLQASQRATRLSRWHLQAGIAAEHAVAPTFEATDWAAIDRHYRLLVQADPSAAPRLGAAIARVEAGDAAGGLGLLEALETEVPAALQAHAWAAKAQALVKLGRPGEAHHWLARAVVAARRDGDRRLLAQRLATLTATHSTGAPACRP
jgi:RNA polymerase sigma-70 factor (ECF subfamily)